MKCFKRFSKMLALATVLTMLLGVCAFADSQRPYFFDFEQMVINLAPGDVYKMPVRVYDGEHPTFSVYIRGNESNETYVWSDFKCGWTNVDIHIGKDETSKGLTLYFYIDETETFDNIQVRIVDPSKSAIIDTQRNAEKIRLENAQYTENKKLIAQYNAKLKEKEAKEQEDLLAQYYAALARQQARENANK